MSRGPDWPLIGGLAMFALVGCGGCGLFIFSALAPPPPGPPVPNGTTIAELGRLQPGKYYRNAAFEELPKAREASASRLDGFHGPVQLRHPGVAEAALYFSEGRRSAEAWNPAPPPALTTRIPVGTPAREAILRFHPKTDARLADAEATMAEVDIPGDATRYERFTGELWRIEDGADDGRIFRATFRRGRTVAWDTHVIVG